MPCKLSTEQLYTLVTAHCHRVINNMNHDDLISYAMQMMMESFDSNPGSGDTDQEMLICDILTAEGEDYDSAHEFIVGEGIDPDVAEELLRE